MNQPLVSVIIPNYNHAQYLEKRFDTVLNQIYQNIEIIILDDKSTDNSIEIIEKYKNHPKVSQIIINEQNTGSPFKQWDKGISLAKGDLIWIAESDDYNELNFLEEIIVEWNKRKNIIVAFSNYVMFWDDYFIYPSERKCQCWDGKYFIKNRQARGNKILNASGVVFSKEAYKKINKSFLSFKSAGDYMFWVEMLFYGNVIKVNKNLTYWRQHNNSVTSNNISKGILANEDKKIFDYILNNYSLNKWQYRMAIAQHIECYSSCNYDNDEIRNNILSYWKNKISIFKINSLLKWLIGTLERHFNILV